MATGRVPTTANSPLTAKGDLFGYSTTQARVAVGSDGDTLVADSAATTGLRWQGNYAAGKNKIINGDFRINQRSFTTITTGSGYGFDRWTHATNGGTITYSTQNFTAGAAPVAGYEAITFARMDVAGGGSAGNFCILQQKIEDVRTFAGETVTVSFWAKSDANGDKLGVELFQNFGSGGSASTGANGQSVTLTTSWVRYSVTISNPSVSGKTIGTSSLLELNLWVSGGSTFNTRSGTVGVQTAVIDIWGVQVESGSVATAFQTATGTLQGELAACQRYYYRLTTDSGSPYALFSSGGFFTSTTNFTSLIQHPVPMRVKPSSLDISTVAAQDDTTAILAITASSIDANLNGNTLTGLSHTVAGATAARFGRLLANNSASGYIGFSAEL
jgi:hypothetical protein